MRHILPSPWTGLILLVLLTPMVVLVSYIFTENTRVMYLWQYGLLQNDLGNTLLLACGAAGLSLLLAVPAAWLQVRYCFPLRRTLNFTHVLPLSIPAYVLAYVYADLTSFAGPIQTTLRALVPQQPWLPAIVDMRNLQGAIMVFAFGLYPYAYLILRRTIKQQGDNWLEVAQSLGSPRTEALLRIALPMLRPALIIAGALVVLECLSDLGVAELLGVRTLALRIKVLWLNKGELGSAAVVAFLLFTLSIAVFIAQRHLQQRHHSHRTPRPIKRIMLSGVPAVLATLYNMMLPMLGFGIPVFWLIRQPLSSNAWQDETLWHVAMNSLMTAILVACIALLVALALLVKLRFTNGLENRYGIALASYGYGTPGLVLALGCIAPAFAIDQLLARTQEWLGMDPQAWLAGSLVTLVFALSVRLIAVALAPLDESYQRIAVASDDAARTLGLSTSGIVWRNHLPHLHPAMATAFLFLFLEALKELPATLLARPPGFDTLATRFFALAGDERIYEAAPYALLIIVLSLPVVVLLNRDSSGKVTPVKT